MGYLLMMAAGEVRPAGWHEEDRSGTLEREFIASRDELAGAEIPLTDEWSATRVHA